jgi:hypothetical protein
LPFARVTADGGKTKSFEQKEAKETKGSGLGFSETLPGSLNDCRLRAVAFAWCGLNATIKEAEKPKVAQASTRC